MSGTEQRGGNPNPDRGLPKKDQELNPRFSLSRNFAQRFSEMGMNSIAYGSTISNFDSFLSQASNAENLLAIGFIGVRGDQPNADVFISHQGVQIEIISYWSSPKSEINPKIKNPESEFGRFDETIGKINAETKSIFQENVFVLGGDPISNDDITLHEFETELTNNESRKKHTFSWAMMQELGVRGDVLETELWGFATTDQLRRELQDSNS